MGIMAQVVIIREACVFESYQCSTEVAKHSRGQPWSRLKANTVLEAAWSAVWQTKKAVRQTNACARCHHEDFTTNEICTYPQEQGTRLAHPISHDLEIYGSVLGIQHDCHGKIRPFPSLVVSILLSRSDVLSVSDVRTYICKTETERRSRKWQQRNEIPS